MFDLAFAVHARIDDLDESLDYLCATIDGLVAMAPDEFGE